MSYRSPLPGSSFPVPFGRRFARPSPRSVPGFSQPFDGFLLRQPATVFQAAADPGVQRVSICHEAEIPELPARPSKRSLRPQRRKSALPLIFVGITSGPSSFRTTKPSPNPLPSHPFPPALPHLVGSQGLSPRDGSVATQTVSSSGCPVLPWA